jgi:glycosyltransferase involved in cell wall biosynthesis
MSRLTVSTIIPAYKAARTIGRAVDSVLAQTRPSAEILVVDDGSPDDLSYALRPYGDRVTLIRKPNGGAASARNRGIDEAKGDLIAFLDADDSWEPMKLERHLEIFERYPQVGLTASRFFTREPDGPQVPPSPNGERVYDQVLQAHGEDAFSLATMVWTGTVVVKRLALGEHRFVSGLEPAEDRDLWVRLISENAVYFLSDPLATAVLEPDSLSRGDQDVAYNNMLRVVHRNRELLGRRGLRNWERNVYRQWAGVQLGKSLPRKALKPAWKRVRLEPLSPEAWWVLVKSAAWACSESSKKGVGSDLKRTSNAVSP